MARVRDHDWGFWAYAVVGFLLPTGLLYWPVLVVALPLAAVVYRRYEWPNDLGLLFGFGAVALALAAANTDDAATWLAIGAVLATGSTFAFWRLRCRPGS